MSPLSAIHVVQDTVLYNRTTADRVNLWGLDAVTGGNQRLLHDPGADYLITRAEFNCNGTWIGYVKTDYTTTELRLVRPDGSGDRLLYSTSMSRYYSTVDFHPTDPTLVLFTNKAGVHTIRIDGSDFTTLVSGGVGPDSEGEMSCAQYDHDGSRIAWAKRIYGSGGILATTPFQQIYVADADGSSPTQVYDGQDVSGYPSPNLCWAGSGNPDAIAIGDGISSGGWAVIDAGGGGRTDCSALGGHGNPFVSTSCWLDDDQSFVATRYSAPWNYLTQIFADGTTPINMTSEKAFGVSTRYGRIYFTSRKSPDPFPVDPYDELVSVLADGTFGSRRFEADYDAAESGIVAY